MWHCPFNRTFENQTQLNPVELNPRIEFGNQIKANAQFCVRMISERIELNQTNGSGPNSIHKIVFYWFWQLNLVEHISMGCIWLSWLSTFAWTKVKMLCGLKTHNKRELYWEVTRTSKNLLILIFDTSFTKKSRPAIKSSIAFDCPIIIVIVRFALIAELNQTQSMYGVWLSLI